LRVPHASKQIIPIRH